MEENEYLNTVRAVAMELIYDFGAEVSMLTIQERAKSIGVEPDELAHEFATARVTITWDDDE